MSSPLILPEGSALRQAFTTLVQQQRFLMFAGVPGVGKSLLLQQAAHLAHQNGRILHQMQWDVSRTAFELHPYVLEHYPETDGVTHPVVRKAVGLWSRGALYQWHQQFAEAQHLLLGEVPLIGNRFIELVQSQPDDVEALLKSEAMHFVVPAPSKEIRATIEAARAKTIAAPRDAQEKWDAPPNVLQMVWDDVYALAYRIGLTNTPAAVYAPDLYLGVFLQLLKHRQATSFLINENLKPSQSAYVLPPIATELRATPDQVLAYIQQVEDCWSLAEVEAAIANWHQI